jgi:hypothetical protein
VLFILPIPQISKLSAPARLARYDVTVNNMGRTMSEIAASIRRTLKRVWLTVTAIAVLLSSCLSRAQRCPKAGERPGYWSTLAAVVCEDTVNGKMQLEMQSPDRKRTLFAQGQNLDGKLFLKSGDQSNTAELSAVRPGEEVLWSLDSEELAVTTCFGASGPCVVWTSQDDNRETPGEIVKKTFAAGHEGDACYTEANTGALTWEDGSDKIVIIAEVPPNPQCEGHSDGYFEAFVVSLSERKVISRFNMKETTHRWHRILGTGLRSDIALVREDTKTKQR